MEDKPRTDLGQAEDKKDLRRAATEGKCNFTGRRVSTLQEENFHWNFNFAILLMENSLSLNIAHLKIFINLSMIAYVIQIQKSKFANI